MAYCDFCTCGDCQEGTRYLRHAPTVDGRWICDVCWQYEACIDGKRAAAGVAYGEKSRGRFAPCVDEYGKPIADCGHRPKLAGDFRR